MTPANQERLFALQALLLKALDRDPAYGPGLVKCQEEAPTPEHPHVTLARTLTKSGMKYEAVQAFVRAWAAREAARSAGWPSAEEDEVPPRVA